MASIAIFVMNLFYVCSRKMSPDVIIEKGFRKLRPSNTFFGTVCTKTNANELKQYSNYRSINILSRCKENQDENGRYKTKCVV